MEYNIDNGKIDGIILNSGNIFKISDTGIISTNIRLKVKQGKKGAKTEFYSLRDIVGNVVTFKLANFFNRRQFFRINRITWA